MSIIWNQDQQAQFGQMYIQQQQLCSHPSDPLEHVKQRLAELKQKLAKVADWEKEAACLERMIEAAK